MLHQSAKLGPTEGMDMTWATLASRHNLTGDASMLKFSIFNPVHHLAKAEHASIR